MKKQLISLSLAVLVTISSAFAGNRDGASDKAIRSFNKEFAQATNVQWDTNREFQKATFELNGQLMFAYYSKDGELLAISRNITTAQLPMRLSASLKQQYGNYWISDLFEMASNNESSYYITLENAETVTVMRAVGSGGWELYRKSKKEAL
jgi:hypothetical protein